MLVSYKQLDCSLMLVVPHRRRRAQFTDVQVLLDFVDCIFPARVSALRRFPGA